MSGSVINLICVAEGTPTPTVTWLKNLMPLPSDPRYQVTSVGGVGMLSISQAWVLDEGEYNCEVSISNYSFWSMDKATVTVTYGTYHENIVSYLLLINPVFSLCNFLMNGLLLINTL